MWSLYRKRGTLTTQEPWVPYPTRTHFNLIIKVGRRARDPQCCMNYISSKLGLPYTVYSQAQVRYEVNLPVSFQFQDALLFVSNDFACIAICYPWILRFTKYFFHLCHTFPFRPPEGWHWGKTHWWLYVNSLWHLHWSLEAAPLLLFFSTTVMSIFSPGMREEVLNLWHACETIQTWMKGLKYNMHLSFNLLP